MSEQLVSPESRDRIIAWFAETCPGQLDHEEFLPNLFILFESVVDQEVRRVCWMRLRSLREPCRN